MCAIWTEFHSVETSRSRRWRSNWSRVEVLRWYLDTSVRSPHDGSSGAVRSRDSCSISIEGVLVVEAVGSGSGSLPRAPGENAGATGCKESASTTSTEPSVNSKSNLFPSPLGAILSIPLIRLGDTLCTNAPDASRTLATIPAVTESPPRQIRSPAASTGFGVSRWTSRSSPGPPENVIPAILSLGCNTEERSTRPTIAPFDNDSSSMVFPSCEIARMLPSGLNVERRRLSSASVPLGHFVSESL